MTTLLRKKRGVHALLQRKTTVLSYIPGLRSDYTMEQHPDYSKWSTNDLISRVTTLEQQLQTQTLRYEGHPQVYSKH